MSGGIIASRPKRQAEMVADFGQLIGPAICGSEPEKSKVIRSPATFMASRSVTGPPMLPSSSSDFSPDRHRPERA